MTPEPPEGYRLLTDEEKTKPLPMDAVYWQNDGADWQPSCCQGGLTADPAGAYATRATPELDVSRDVVELVEGWRKRALEAEAELTRLRAVIAPTLRIVRDFVAKNPKHEFRGVEQDPWGSHALLAQLESQLNPL